MDTTILPFSPDHVEPAATLLAARHRRDRLGTPSLSSAYEDLAATVTVVRDLLAEDGTSGVVALRGERVVAYLLGTLSLGSPTRTFAGFMHPRAADIPYAGHAAEAGDAPMLYPRLYAPLAQGWVAGGLVGHYVTVPADRDATDPWLDLGFAPFITMAVRPTTPPAERADRPATDITVRRATADDEATVQALVTDLLQTFADPPIFVPFLPETAAERAKFVADRLADPACPCWLAFVNGRPVGLQVFEEPSSTHWHQSPLESVPRGVYLFLAYTVPEARGTGVGPALLAPRWRRRGRRATTLACSTTWPRAGPLPSGEDSASSRCHTGCAAPLTSERPGLADWLRLPSGNTVSWEGPR